MVDFKICLVPFTSVTLLVLCCSTAILVAFALKLALENNFVLTIYGPKIKKEYIRQCTYKRKSDAPSRKYCQRGIPISITHSECMSVALVIQLAMRMRRRIIIYGLSGTAVYFLIIS